MEVVGTIAILYLTSTYKKQDLLTLTIYWGGIPHLSHLSVPPVGEIAGKYYKAVIIKQTKVTINESSYCRRKSQLMKALIVDGMPTEDRIKFINLLLGDHDEIKNIVLCNNNDGSRQHFHSNLIHTR